MFYLIPAETDLYWLPGSSNSLYFDKISSYKLFNKLSKNTVLCTTKFCEYKTLLFFKEIPTRYHEYSDNPYYIYLDKLKDQKLLKDYENIRKNSYSCEIWFTNNLEDAIKLKMMY